VGGGGGGGAAVSSLSPPHLENVGVGKRGSMIAHHQHLFLPSHWTHISSFLLVSFSYYLPAVRQIFIGQLLLSSLVYRSHRPVSPSFSRSHRSVLVVLIGQVPVILFGQFFSLSLVSFIARSCHPIRSVSLFIIGQFSYALIVPFSFLIDKFSFHPLVNSIRPHWFFSFSFH
jgi:hypothetical protein